MPVPDHFWSVAAAITCIKVLLISAYKSTDFEVHRNWLAITHSLPVKRWYYEAYSEWTLDYPPLFAWFEYLLSQIAYYFDPQMLKVQNLGYASSKTVLFQRLSVIGSDIFLIYATKEFCELLGKKSKKKKGGTLDPWVEPAMILSMLMLWNPGLLMVDHIHFQYNGFLHGILLISIIRIIQDRCVEGAIWFAVLLNLKHIYLYVAPAYFVYLFCSYCFMPTRKEPNMSWKTFSFKKFAKLGGAVAVVFLISFGPFIYWGQLNQVLSRLFPFKRGLTHAYWAPNFWALYNTLDKGLAVLGKFAFGKSGSIRGVATMTGGLVQEFNHEVLPSISPPITLLLTLCFILPVLYYLWRNPNDPWLFLRAVILCAFGSFMFGWHVHEKAILLVLIPMIPLTMQSVEDAKEYAFLSAVAQFSLFPLLFKEAETPIKVLMLLMYCVYTFTSFEKHYKNPRTGWIPFLSNKESLYLAGLVLLQLYYSFGNQMLGLQDRLPFLPLMLISAYCSLGVLYSWLRFYSTSVGGKFLS